MKVLLPRTFTVSRHYSDMGREVSELEWAMEIEGPPNYKGYRLNPDLREELTKVQRHKLGV